MAGAASLRRRLAGKELYLFDLDGVFYKGKETRVRIGGDKVVEALRSKGKKLLVLTNNSTDSATTIWSRLRRFGIPVMRNEVLTSSMLTARYLLEKKGKVDYCLVGERGLDLEMTAAGHRRTEGEDADVVVVGLDRRITYEKLDRAARLARSGAEIIATHNSKLYMSNAGPAMAPGPIVKALEFASGRRATVIGKPSPLMFRMALKIGACNKEDAVMVGDQLETDFEGARRSGIDFILVQTGVDRPATLSGAVASLSNVDDLAPLV